MPWLNSDTGEMVDHCPHCAQTARECDDQLTALERDLRTWRSRTTRAEKLLDAQTSARHNKKDWETVFNEWLSVFPGVPRPRSTSVKSARAQEFFSRLDHGARVEDVLNAIHGAKERPYLRYGKRARDGGGPGTTKAVDLADICGVKGTHAESNFDLLCAEGADIRGAAF